MEEKEKYETAEQEKEAEAEAEAEAWHIYRYYSTEGPPPSILHTTFDSPGSAIVLEMKSEGIVTPEQLAAAGIFMICRACQEWSIPLVHSMMQSVVRTTITEFVAEMSKPRISTPPFFVPPAGGRPL